MNAVWPWIAVAGLGAYHGIDPSMGWLFAVALGLQEHSRSRLLRSLIPIALGHLASIAVVVALFAWAQWLIDPDFVRWGGAAILILFGVFRALRPHAHPRWVKMRVGALDLVLWSFLMASAHGAGLMLFPILISIPTCAPLAAGHLVHQHMMNFGPVPLSPLGAVLVVLVHTGATLVMMGAIAIIVYDRVGLKILRSAWINLDTVWAGALVAAGLLSLAL